MPAAALRRPSEEASGGQRRRGVREELACRLEGSRLSGNSQPRFLVHRKARLVLRTRRKAVTGTGDPS
jgi:hypothetical protein